MPGGLYRPRETRHDGRVIPGSEAVDAYLAAVPEAQRAALQRLRATIRSAAPDAVETISYQMPAFRLGGKFLVSYAAFKGHCSLFPLSGGVLDQVGDEVAPYRAGKGTLRFTVEQPVPASLVTKIVRIRIREVLGGG
jgi:uncharacterized protein YdhG (YjbR/CyaY superfamily)